MPLAVVGALLLVLGAAAAAVGILPWPAVGALAERVGPILAFVAAITVVTELLNAAGLFEWMASYFRRWGRGRVWVLWLLVVGLSLAATVFLSLDTTAVLLTPIVVVLARRCGLPPLPFALTTVWLANTGSLLLPVSNLTNLLALHALGSVSPGEFAARMALPALWCAAVPVAAVALVFRRELAGRYNSVRLGRVQSAPSDGGTAATATDPVLLGLGAGVLALLLPALVTGVPVWIPSTAAALVLLVAFGARRRGVLKWALVPWQLLVFAAGLFLVMEALQYVGARELAAAALGTGDGPGSLVRVAAVGAVGANVINNLPAYLAFEQAAGGPARLAALLVGVNAGPLVAPWASLATLIWHEQLRRLGVGISWWGYAAAGAVLVPLMVVPAALLAALG
ncbi:SLC13 family permease [Sinomonas atrocyanea]|uniref:SLC13 family permease n=1 Tax=Sinomonas atrocyanea TaxID=37927 RepID=UPI00277D2158|nr:SLC13 family permease [Sinomonas atrocyanea]MDQ0258865.1 Na+/H+ antiporter NhaD/arsenite permease-like protein [Sinomonas atrocyanea]MDR6621052.1 Na+/H+ antiporter NhaD/arsenite permease-like protein [Sinomonas atrocyanea]